jgi:hypothetical protein
MAAMLNGPKAARLNLERALEQAGMDVKLARQEFAASRERCRHWLSKSCMVCKPLEAALHKALNVERKLALMLDSIVNPSLF